MLSRLSDKELVASYVEATKLGLERNFISSLEQEILIRIKNESMKVEEMGVDPKLFSE